MKFAKSIVTGTGAVILAGLILALLAPKAAHAIAATLVQVTNTSANPVVVQSTPTPAAQLVNLSFVGSGGQTLPLLAIKPNGEATQFVVPANQYLVITGVEFSPNSVTGCSASSVQVGIILNSNASIENSIMGLWVTPASGPVGTNHYEYSSGIPVAPSSAPTVTILGNCYLAGGLHGYLSSN